MEFVASLRDRNGMAEVQEASPARHSGQMRVYNAGSLSRDDGEGMVVKSREQTGSQAFRVSSDQFVHIFRPFPGPRSEVEFS